MLSGAGNFNWDLNEDNDQICILERVVASTLVYPGTIEWMLLHMPKSDEEELKTTLCSGVCFHVPLWRCSPSFMGFFLFLGCLLDN